MNQNDIETHSGYYLVTIRPSVAGPLLHTNNERALIISCLQDTLSTRNTLIASNPNAQLAIHIDLLSFSVLKEGVQLIAFTISRASLQILTHILTSKLAQYQSDTFIHYSTKKPYFTPIISIRQLVGPHEALNTTIQLHLNHTDWEFDRYSSIGFYLHDRRGDWVRLWRLSQLYENNTDNYYRLIEQYLENSSIEAEKRPATYPLYVTSKHA